MSTDTVQQTFNPLDDQCDTRPEADRVRGVCPVCGSDLLSNCEYVKSRGYLMTWSCRHSLGETPTCSYRKVL